MTDRTASRPTIGIVPLIIFTGPVYDAALGAAVAVRFTRVPVGGVLRNARVRIGLPHERRTAVVHSDSLSARVEESSAAECIVARSGG